MKKWLCIFLFMTCSAFGGTITDTNNTYVFKDISVIGTASGNGSGWTNLPVSIIVSNESIIIPVGPSETFTTINAALKYATTTYYPAYNENRLTNDAVIIRLQNGYTNISDQVIVQGQNLGWITIDHVGGTNVTNMVVTSTMTNKMGNTYYPLFGAYYGTLPAIKALFQLDSDDIDLYTNRVGVYLLNQSNSFVYPGAGVQKAYVGAYVTRTSRLAATLSNFSNSRAHNIYVSYSSQADVCYANLTNANWYGIYASYDSIVSADSADISGAGTYGIYAAYASIINASSANADNAGTYGIYAVYGSIINASSAKASNAGSYGLYAYSVSRIGARSVTATNAGTYGMYAIHGSEIDAASSDTSYAGGIGIYANGSSKISAQNAIVKNVVTNYAIYARADSSINAESAVATGAGGMVYMPIRGQELTHIKPVPEKQQLMVLMILSL